MKNPINKSLLWLTYLLSPIYRWLGVDLAQLKAILAAKLIIDDRRATGLYKVRRQNQTSETSNATLFTMLMSMLTGLFLCVSFMLSDDVTRMTLYFGMFGFLLAMFLITDFSDILIDTKDNLIILPKPVSGITFTVARLLHIWIHLVKIVLPLSLSGFLFTLFSRGIMGGFSFYICIFFLTLLTFTFVNAIYLMIVGLFSPGKLNSIISSLQIIFSVIMYASFQLLPRIMDQAEIESLVMQKSWWTWLIPAYWFAQAWNFMFTLSLQDDAVLGLCLSIIIPVVGIWMVVRYLAPAFFRKISLIYSDVSIQQGKRKSKSETGQQGISSLLASLFGKSVMEREAFRFTWKMTGRARDFKMKVYPQVGYLLVLLVMFSFRSWKQLMLIDTSFTEIHDSRMIILILSMIYFSVFIFMGAVLQLPFSEQFRSGWIYFIAPVENPGLIIRGAIKACLIKFLLIPICFLTIFGLSIFGWAIIPNLIFGFGNLLLMCVGFSWLAMNKLPFSIPLKDQRKGTLTLRNVFMLLILPVFVLPHYLLFNHPVFLLILSVITWTMGLVGLYYTRHISWNYMKGIEA